MSKILSYGSGNGIGLDGSGDEECNRWGVPNDGWRDWYAYYTRGEVEQILDKYDRLIGKRLFREAFNIERRNNHPVEFLNMAMRSHGLDIREL